MDSKTAEQHYQAAKEYLYRLEKDNTLRTDRRNWLQGIRSFRAIHSAERKGVLGPPSLYMIGKMHRLMFAQFKVPMDRENATTSFLELADLYPGHALADDALYNAAESITFGGDQAHEATILYQKIVDTYPNGDHFEKAKARITGQEKSSEPITPRGQSIDSPPQGLAHLLPIKHWTSENYCRLVIPASASVAFAAGLLEQNGVRSNKIYVDFFKSYLPSEHRNPAVPANGLLKQIHLGSSADNAVRVELELNAIAEYKIFSLDDPFRVVVDVYGDPKSSSPPRVSTVAIAEPKPPATNKAPSTTILPIIPGDTTVTAASLTEQKKHLPGGTAPALTQSPNSEKLSLAQQLGLGIRKIVIDPGHGGKDPGAMAFGLKEKDIVLNVAKKIAQILKSVHRYEVVLTRTKDVYVPLEERTALANTHKSDLFISIHVNAHADQTNGGIETYFLNLATDAHAMRVAAFENATSTHRIGEMQDILATLMKNSKIDESARLAHFVQHNLVSALGSLYRTRDLGVKQAPFYVLIGAQMPAILAEISFITNPAEAKLLQNDRYLHKIAEQIAAGIVAYVDHHHTAAVRLQR